MLQNLKLYTINSLKTDKHIAVNHNQYMYLMPDDGQYDRNL
jgi:hypothetical protein